MTAKEKFINACREHGVNEYFLQGCMDNAYDCGSIICISTLTDHVMRFWYRSQQYGMTDVCETLASLHDNKEFMHALFDPDDCEGTPELWGGDAQMMKKLFDWFATENFGDFPLPLQALDCTQFMNNFDNISVDTEFEDDENHPCQEDEAYIAAEGARAARVDLLSKQLQQMREVLIAEITNLVKRGWTWRKDWDYLVWHDMSAMPLDNLELKYDQYKDQVLVIMYDDEPQTHDLNALSTEYLLKIYSELEA